MIECQLGDCLHFIRLRFGTGWIVQVVVNDQPRARRDARPQVVQIDFKIFPAFDKSIRQSDTAVKLDLRLVNGVSRIRIQDFVTRVHQSQHEFSNRRFATGLYNHVFHGVVDVARAAHVVGNRLAQRRDPVIGTIPCLAVPSGFQGGFDDVFRSGDIDVAQMKRIDVIALRSKSGGFSRYGKGCLGTQVSQSVGKLNRSCYGHQLDLQRGLDIRQRWTQILPV